MGLVLTLIGSIASSITVVKEKDTGTLEQLLMYSFRCLGDFVS
jgi:ABC-2 type transport system permease protein